MAVLTPALKERWDRDGWCIVPGLIPPDELAAAQVAMHRHFPTPAEMADRGGTESGVAHLGRPVARVSVSQLTPQRFGLARQGH
jgi:hypothetical protein